MICGLYSIICFLLMAHCSMSISQTSPNGTEYFTQHSFRHPINPTSIAFSNPPFLEHHFHVYWFHHNEASYSFAMQLRQQLIKSVENKDFVVVLDGITKKILPGINESNIPIVHTEPSGPHPIGNYEVWTPIESLGKVVPFMMANRGELTILLHPLSNDQVEDHVGRTMWLGQKIALDLTLLEESGNPDNMEEWGDPPQYPELGLGYHGKKEALPGQWWKL